MKTITVAKRFCGPASSSNGGYFAGLVATLASDTLAVRLVKPPPLDTELEITLSAARVPSKCATAMR